MIRKVEKFTDDFISTGLVIVVVTILGFSVASIILRWFNLSFSWIDPLVRHLVFVLAFFGAAMASGKSRHIAIEILPKFLENSGYKKSLFVLNKFISLCTIVGATWLFASGVQFYNVEKEYGRLSSLGVHTSVLVGIIPAGFALIFWRSLLAFLDFREEEHELNNN